ncbi:MAG TPA: hypothetical protein VN083_12170, partial [Vicinamibacteria bacterium]|nr:hypothetical protein [Vicinamibacteria bacterium]
MIVLLGRLFRVLAGLLLLRLVLRALVGRGRKAPPRPDPQPGRGGDLVRDAVCNTHLPRERALHARIGGQECYFCSESCRDQAI